MKDVASRIVERINREVGTDIKNLGKCKNIVSEYKQRISKIESELLIEDNDVPSKVRATLTKCQQAHDALALESAKIDNFQEAIDTKLNEYQDVLQSVLSKLNKIRSLQCLVEYFKILKDIQEVSKSLTTNLKGKDDQKTVGLYLSLYGGPDSPNNIIGRLENVEAYHLKSYAEGTAVYWFSVIKDKFSKWVISNVQRTMLLRSTN